jgi:hypothetical protein
LNYDETMELLISLLSASEKCLDAGNRQTARIWYDLFVRSWRAHFREGIGVTSIQKYYVHFRYNTLRQRILEDPKSPQLKEESGIREP